MFDCDELSVCGSEVWRQARGNEYRPNPSFWTAMAIRPASEYSLETDGDESADVVGFEYRGLERDISGRPLPQLTYQLTHLPGKRGMRHRCDGC